MLSKSGPGDLLIIVEPSWKNMFVNLGLTKFRKCSKSVCPRYQVFLFVFGFCFGCSCDGLSTYFENNFTKMRIEK